MIFYIFPQTIKQSSLKFSSPSSPNYPLVPNSPLLLSKLDHHLTSWSREKHCVQPYLLSHSPSLNVSFLQPLCYDLIQTTIIFHFGFSKNFLTGLPTSILAPLQPTQKAKIVLKFKLNIIPLKNLQWLPDVLRITLGNLRSHSRWLQPITSHFYSQLFFSSQPY